MVRKSIPAIVLDVHGNIIDRLNGTYDDGVYTYKQGQTKIPIIGIEFGGNTKTAEFDYEKLIKVPKLGKTAYYEYKGKGLTQLNFGANRETSTAVDYIKNAKLGAYAEASVLKQPTDKLENVAKWLLMMEIAVAVGVLVYMGGVFSAQLQHSAAPFSKIANLTVVQETFNSNQIAHLQIEENTSLAIIKEQNAYIQSLGGNPIGGG